MSPHANPEAAAFRARPRRRRALHGDGSAHPCCPSLTRPCGRPAGERWRAVPPVEGTLVMNVGDIMHIGLPRLPLQSPRPLPKFCPRRPRLRVPLLPLLRPTALAALARQRPPCNRPPSPRLPTNSHGIQL